MSTGPPHDESGRVRDDSTEPVPAVGLVEQLSAHWRIAAVALVVLTVVATLIVSLRPSSKTEAAASASPPSTERSIPLEPSSKASTTDQAELNPTATRGSDVRPPKPAAASGVAAGTRPAAPPTATVAKRTAAQTPMAEAPARAATVADDTATAERDILERHQRWFDAFDRGDRATMASLASDNFSIVDKRPERAPGRVERTIRDIRVRVTGIGAVLSGQIAETATADEAATVAMLSEVWIRREEEWQLVSVRMVPLDAVPKTLQ